MAARPGWTETSLSGVSSNQVFTVGRIKLLSNYKVDEVTPCSQRAFRKSSDPAGVCALPSITPHSPWWYLSTSLHGKCLFSKICLHMLWENPKLVCKGVPLDSFPQIVYSKLSMSAEAHMSFQTVGEHKGECGWRTQLCPWTLHCCWVA